METASSTLHVRMVKAEVTGTLLLCGGCVTCTVGSEYLIRKAPNGTPQAVPVGYWVIGFQRRQRTDHRLVLYDKALKEAQRESVETTIRKRHIYSLRGPYGGQKLSGCPADWCSGYDGQWGESDTKRKLLHSAESAKSGQVEGGWRGEGGGGRQP